MAMIGKVKSFFDEARQEFKRVNWPTFQETVRLTTIVVVFSLAMALFLGVLNFLFTTILREII
jgi:preprotein translocase subunit SecE